LSTTNKIVQFKTHREDVKNNADADAPVEKLDTVRRNGTSSVDEGFYSLLENLKNNDKSFLNELSLP